MDERFTYLVEKYLDHNLTETEKNEFEKYLAEPLCMDYLEKAIKAEKLMMEGFRLLKTEADDFQYGKNISEETREAVRLMHRNMLNRRKRIRLFSYAGMAAAVLIGLVFFWASHPKPTPQLLFKQYYRPFEYLTVRGTSEGYIIYANAVSYYMGGNYEGCSKICREFLATQPPVPDVHFLYALNLMQMDSLQSALEQFNAATDFPLEKNSYFYVSVYWYKSLCYLAMGKADSALVELDRIKGVEKGSVKGVDVEGLSGEIRHQNKKWKNTSKDLR
jgi:tetratricopeptide (TPR) repeat protein